MTSSGEAAGEASDASAIQMDNVPAPPGENLGALPSEGFGIDRNGTGAFVSSGSFDLTSLANRFTESTVQHFDQSTNIADGTVVSSPSGHGYGTLDSGSPGVFPGNTGLYQDYDWRGRTVTYHTFDVTTGKPGPAWVPPAGYLPPPLSLFIRSGHVVPADNQSADNTAFFSGINHQGDTWKVFTSNVHASTFGPVYGLAPALTGMDTGGSTLGAGAVLLGIAQDTKRNTATVWAYNYAAGMSRLVTVNLNDGSLTSMDLPADSATNRGPAGQSMAIDPATGNVLIATPYTVGVYNVANHTGGLHVTGGFFHFATTVDSTRGEFLVAESAGEDFRFNTPNPHAPGNLYGSTVNNNSLSSVLVVDAQGNVLRRIEKFAFGGYLTQDTASLIQVNPSTGIAYTYGQDAVNLESFDYVH